MPKQKRDVLTAEDHARIAKTIGVTGVLSAEDAKSLLEEGVRNVKATEQDRKHRRHFTGPYDPKLHPKGKCCVCAGAVIEKITERWDLGAHARYVPDGLFCTECGIRYEFLPE